MKLYDLSDEQLELLNDQIKTEQTRRANPYGDPNIKDFRSSPDQSKGDMYSQDLEWLKSTAPGISVTEIDNCKVAKLPAC